MDSLSRAAQCSCTGWNGVWSQQMFQCNVRLDNQISWENRYYWKITAQLTKDYHNTWKNFRFYKNRMFLMLNNAWIFLWIIIPRCTGTLLLYYNNCSTSVFNTIIELRFMRKLKNFFTFFQFKKKILKIQVGKCPSSLPSSGTYVHKLFKILKLLWLNELYEFK